MSAPHPFFMMRHGETDWNREQRFQGQVDIALNDLGRSQASAYAGMFAAINADVSTGWRFVASPLSRARDTMEIMRGALGLDPADYVLDERLVEVTFGEWETHRLDDLAKIFPKEVAEREADKWNYVPPRGESYAMVVPRVRSFLESIQGPTVIVAHGGIIRATRYLIEGLPGEKVAEIPVPQDDTYRFDGERGGWISGRA